MSSKNALLFIHAQTSLHPGTGTALGTVDMPIQRERHTAWPMIAGSSLKGVVRDKTRPPDKKSDEWNQWLSVFGAENGDPESHAGALALTDARILAFPVRSAKGVFAWVTCPAVLARLMRDATLAGIADLPFKGDEFLSLENSSIESVAFAAQDTPLAIDENNEKRLLLEEFDFTLNTNSGSMESVKPIAEWIGKHATADEFSQKRIANYLVVISDTEFTHFAKNATEVAARIGLDYETKTVTGGALFYEEFLPTETLMYAVVLANSSRWLDSDSGNGAVSKAMTATEVLNFLTSRLNKEPILQIGANETIGKGLCSVRFESNTVT